MSNAILTPTVIIAVLGFLKYCVKRFAQYKELKLLVTADKERVTVTKNGVSYKK